MITKGAKFGQGELDSMGTRCSLAGSETVRIAPKRHRANTNVIIRDLFSVCKL